jgi:hypothetical protein
VDVKCSQLMKCIICYLNLVFFHILLHFQESECDFWIALLTHTFPCPCLGREPKVRVMIHAHLLGVAYSFLWDFLISVVNNSQRATKSFFYKSFKKLVH